MRFEWDPKKAKSNEKKHGISFEEAIYVFADKQNITIFDESHSETEERWTTLGKLKNALVVVVCHTYRGEEENIIRIISARKATNKEKKQYFEYN